MLITKFYTLIEKKQVTVEECNSGVRASKHEISMCVHSYSHQMSTPNPSKPLPPVLPEDLQQPLGVLIILNSELLLRDM